MRKLKLQMQISIDGFAAGPNGEHDWVFLSGPDEAGFQKITELAESSDTLLLGRKMSHGFVDHWQCKIDNEPDDPQKTFAQLMVNMRKIVFSRTESAISGKNI